MHTLSKPQLKKDLRNLLNNSKFADNETYCSCIEDVVNYLKFHGAKVDEPRCIDDAEIPADWMQDILKFDVSYGLRDAIYNYIEISAA